MSLTARPMDIAIIILYLMGMAGLGIWYSRRTRTTEEYFLGDRSFPGWARIVAVLASVLMILGAILFSTIQKESMNDLSWIVASVFGGCLLGLFMTGFFTTRIDNRAALIGLGGAVLLNIYLGVSAAGWLPSKLTLPVHSYWTGILVNLLFLILAGTVALIRGRNQKDLSGLTVWTMKGGIDSDE